MTSARALLDLAEDCFRQAEYQENAIVAEALRIMGLDQLERAREAWNQSGSKNGISSDIDVAPSHFKTNVVASESKSRWLKIRSYH